MTLYFLLGTLTSEGQKMWHDNENLMVGLVGNCDHAGAVIMGQYVVLGRYDYVMMVEAQDNQAVARLSLDIGVQAGLHIETLPATSISLPGADSQNQLTSEAESAQGALDPRDQWQLPRRTS